MMTPSPIHNISYYEESTSDDYYDRGGEPKGKWIGLASRSLGLDKVVNTNDYRRVFNGLNLDGQPLCEGVGENHRHGWDLTFSAPKSVSILFAGEIEQNQLEIQEVQQRAVEEALTFLEDKAALTRRGHAGKVHEKVAGLVAATFEHCTSRDQDPQLHTHCLVANISPRLDGTWGTLESKYFYWWQKATGAVYRTALARGLQELGYEVEEVVNEDHFEVRGIAPQICEYFSKRKAAIYEKMKSLGVDKASSKAGDVITLNTRSPKKNASRKDLFASWKLELQSLGHSSEYLSTLRSNVFELIPEALPLQHIAKELTSKQATFRLQDIYAITAKEAQFHYSPYYCIEDTVRELLNDKELVYLGTEKGNDKIYTTQSMLKAERQLIKLAEQLNSNKSYRLEQTSIDHAIKLQEQQSGFPFSNDQIEAIYSVCQSSLDIVQGKAGAGKSISMTSMRIAYENKGLKVRGATVSKQAALQLEHDTGIKSSTLASLLGDINRSPKKYAKTVILLDEAGQLSSLDLLELISSVKSVDAKLILLGEQEQTDAINHGGSLKYLSRKLGCARLNTIRRQREPWARQAINELRSGNALSALNKFNDKGLLFIEKNVEASQKKLVESWKSFIKENPTKKSMIIAYSWKDVISMSSLIRQHYQEQGIVGDENIVAECNVSNKVLEFAFSKGERVRFTKNDYSLNFTNGGMGTIIDIKKIQGDIKFTVSLDCGRLVTFNQTDYSDENGRLNLVQAYASTVYSSQGATIDGDTFVLYSTSMDRASSYVAGSRHKDKCHWFANSEELDASLSEENIGIKGDLNINKMAQFMSVDRKKSLAIEYLPEQVSEIVNKRTKDLELIE